MIFLLASATFIFFEKLARHIKSGTQQGGGMIGEPGGFSWQVVFNGLGRLIRVCSVLIVDAWLAAEPFFPFILSMPIENLRK
ncbi:MAG: hypothetical protein D3910_09450 [Candidatus Electrothrix sp. ATG2]|nr:hypothetical protein [Candidatus Electrothrix sp. ATG2]